MIVLGAGASGLMCAITAAQLGKKVLVFERANKVGKKILMSGGGRCNFTNMDVEASNFISQNPHFCKAALKRYTQWDFISLVNEHSVAYEERRHGQLFCLDSAKDILNMLLEECDKAGVELRTSRDITRCEPVHGDEHSARYTLTVVKTNRGKKSDKAEEPRPQLFHCRSLVVATGALSIPTLGGSGLGYDIARQFDMPLVERRAGLVPFMFSDATKSMCERLSGLAVEVQLSCNKTSFTENILFTHRGISGPAALQVSNYWQPGDELRIDLLPSFSAPALLLAAKAQSGKQLLRTFLTQHLAKSLVVELQNVFWPEHSERALAEMSDKQLTALGEQLNNWRLKPSGTEGYRTAEVTLGGVNTDSISSKTMEAKAQAGLYFIGEVVDVTGHLGGYNFQWAWSSGYSAGLSIGQQ